MPRTVLYSIDLKDADKSTADLVYDIIATQGLEHHVIWSCDINDTHAYLKELDPEIATTYP